MIFKVAVRVPETVAESSSATPLRSHWWFNGPAPWATTVKETDPPAAASTAAGGTTTKGSCSEVSAGAGFQLG